MWTSNKVALTWLTGQPARRLWTRWIGHAPKLEKYWVEAFDIYERELLARIEWFPYFGEVLTNLYLDRRTTTMLYLGIDQHARQLTISLRDDSGDVLQAR